MQKKLVELLKHVSIIILLILLSSMFSTLNAQTVPAIDMVFVEGGTFTMGCTFWYKSNYYANEMPTHSVTLSSYYIGKYEVTQAQWKAVMGNNPSTYKGDSLPVEEVSWSDASGVYREVKRTNG